MSVVWWSTTGQRHAHVWMRKHRLKITLMRWAGTRLPRYGRGAAFPGLPKSIPGISRLLVPALSGGLVMHKLQEWEGNLVESICSSVHLLGCRCLTLIIVPTVW